jgi:hypothetical protein
MEKKGGLKFQPSTIRNNLKPIKLLCEMNDLTYVEKITLVITRLLGITKSKVVCSYDSIQRGDDSKPIGYFLVFCPIVYDSTKYSGFCINIIKQGYQDMEGNFILRY